MTTYIKVKGGKQHYLDMDRRSSMCGLFLDESEVAKGTEFYDPYNGLACQNCVNTKRSRLRDKVSLATKGEAIGY